MKIAAELLILGMTFSSTLMMEHFKSVYFEKFPNVVMNAISILLMPNVSTEIECVSFCSRHYSCMAVTITRLSDVPLLSCEMFNKTWHRFISINNSNKVTYKKSAAAHCCPQFPTNPLQMCPCKSREAALQNCPQKTVQTYQNGYIADGIYDLQLSSKIPAYYAFCEVDDDEGWIVIQRRFDGSVTFNRTWQEYKDGFGQLHAEFWYGNEKIHQITWNGVYELKFEAATTKDGKIFTGWAVYNRFRLYPESSKYKLEISGFTGSMGDSMEYHNLRFFETWDKQNTNCPSKFDGAWWYGSNDRSGCHRVNFNGGYYASGECPYGVGLSWYTAFESHKVSMTKTTMKIRRAK